MSQGRDNASAQGSDGGAEGKGEGHNISGVYSAEAGGLAVIRTGPHGLAGHGEFKEEEQGSNDKSRYSKDPEHLGGNMSPEYFDRRDLRAREKGQGSDLLVPYVQGDLSDQDGQSDGNDDHSQYRGGFKASDKSHFNKRPNQCGDKNGEHYGGEQGHNLAEGVGDHTAQHNKLPLGEVYDPRGVIDNVENTGAYHTTSANQWVYPVLTAPLAGKNTSDAVCPKSHISELKQFLGSCQKFLIIGTSGLDEDLMTLIDSTLGNDQHVYRLVHIVNYENGAEEASTRFQQNVRVFNNKIELANVFKTGFREYLNHSSFRAFAEFALDRG